MTLQLVCIKYSAPVYLKKLTVSKDFDSIHF